MTPPLTELQIAVPGAGPVSGLLYAPAAPLACYALAHGAGAGMRHAFLQALAEGLAAERVATLRFQFPYMEAGGKRVDAPPLAQATVRAAVAEAGRRLPGVPLLAGGKSFGGRMSSQAQAAQPLPGVCGLAFVGFPLHAAGKPARVRADHLAAVQIPMLFLQGTRDELAEATLVATVCGELAPRATLEWFDDADHSFHVRARSGQTDAQVLERLCRCIAAWARGLPPPER